MPGHLLRPEIGSVGLTEAEAKKRGYDVRVGRFPFGVLAAAHHRARRRAREDRRRGKYDEVLGVHMIGPHATELVAEACVALRLESTIEEIIRTIHAHPTLPEAVMQAADAVHGDAIDA